MIVLAQIDRYTLCYDRVQIAEVSGKADAFDDVYPPAHVTVPERA